MTILSLHNMAMDGRECRDVGNGNICLRLIRLHNNASRDLTSPMDCWPVLFCEVIS